MVLFGQYQYIYTTTMVTKKHCCYGTCNSDTRYPDRPEMAGVFFINFPKPITKRDQCERWIKLCGRRKEDFNVQKITRSTFLCSKHFVGGAGPTPEHPDPIPATTCPEQVQKFIRPKRKAPTSPATPPVHGKKKRLDAAYSLLNLSNVSEDSHCISDFIPPESGHATVGTQTDSTPCNCQNKVQVQDCASQTVNDKICLQSKLDTIIMPNAVKISHPSSSIIIC